MTLEGLYVCWNCKNKWAYPINERWSKVFYEPPRRNCPSCGEENTARDVQVDEHRWPGEVFVRKPVPDYVAAAMTKFQREHPNAR